MSNTHASPREKSLLKRILRKRFLSLRVGVLLAFAAAIVSGSITVMSAVLRTYGPMMPVEPIPLDTISERTLAVPYYNLNGDWESRLMLSNQGPNPMTAQVALFGLHGEHLDVPPVTLAANTIQTFDLSQWATDAMPFQEGSLRVRYFGRARELAGMVKIIQPERSVIFDQQLIEAGEYFKSSRLEGVWWLPSEKAETSIVVTNAGYHQLSATVTLDRKPEGSKASMTFSLGPHEVRVVNPREMLRERGEKLPVIGGVSVTHNESAGAVFAEMLVHDAAAGYSSIIDLRDPEISLLNRLDVGGLRIGRSAGEQMTQVAVARNVSAAATSLTGRVVYTTNDGTPGVIALPEENLQPGEVKSLDVAHAIKKTKLRNVESAGLEFHYTGTPGAVVVTALSVSESGNQVFRLPVVDAASHRTNTGRYPWSIDEESLTIVYLKNVTDEVQEYTMYLLFPGGEYVPGLKTIGPGQTAVFDLKELRDQQIPDAEGKTIPLSAKQGVLSWSSRSTKNLAPGQMEGPEHFVIIGRSEQIDIVNRTSSTGTYGCSCPDSYSDSWIERYISGQWKDPWSAPSSEIYVGDTLQLRARQRDHDCMWNWSPPHEPWGGSGWGSNTVAADDPNGLSVTVVDSNGLLTGQAAGLSNAGSSWFTVRWLDFWDCCEYTPDWADPFIDVTVKPAVTSLSVSMISTKNPITNTRPAAGTFTSIIARADYATVNTAASDLVVLFQGSDPITVTSEGDKPNAGNQLRWAIQKDPTDSLSGAAPTLSAQTGSPITVTPTAAGNFRLLRYFDANSNSAYDAGEHQKVLLIAVVRATLDENGSSIDKFSPSWTGTQAGNPPEFSVTTDGIMAITCVVTLEGGGAQKLIGVNKVTVGDVGNLLTDNSVIHYPIPTPTPAAPGNVAGTVFEIPGPGTTPTPMVDTGNVSAGQEPTGGSTAFRSSNNDPGTGAERVATAEDNPGFGPWPNLHPVTNNPWATTTGGYSFREFIVGYTATFPRYYVVFARGDWTITGVGTRSGNGTWANSSSAVTVGGGGGSSAALTNRIVSGSPEKGDTAGVQVLGKSYVREHTFGHTP